MSKTMNLYGRFSITMTTQSTDLILQFVRQLILHLEVSDVYVSVEPAEQYNVQDIANKFFPQCRLYGEPFKAPTFYLHDVQMVRFSPALFDVLQTKILPDGELFFETDLAFSTATQQLADLLERQKAYMSPFQPTANYNYNELQMSDFPLPLLTREFQPPLRHLVQLSSGKDVLVTFSRAAEVYYLTYKQAALCFVGKLQRCFANLLYIQGTYMQKQRAQLKENRYTTEQNMLYETQYLFAKRKTTRVAIIHRLELAAQSMRRKQSYIDNNVSLFARLSATLSLTPIWSSIQLLLDVDHIRLLSPMHAGMLRGHSNVAIAACNCGYFVVPIYRSKLFNFDSAFYKKAILSGIDRSIYQQLANCKKLHISSANHQVELSFSLRKTLNASRTDFFEYKQEESVSFIPNTAAITKRDLFSGLKINTQGFENFNIELLEKYVPFELEELSCDIRGPQLLGSEAVILFARECQLKQCALAEKMQELADNISILGMLTAAGHRFVPDLTNLDAIQLVFAYEYSASARKAIVSGGRLTHSFAP